MSFPYVLPSFLIFPFYPTWFVMPGSAPAITHVSHLSLITFWLSFNFDLVICLMALHDSVPSSVPVAFVCRCDSTTSHTIIFLPLTLSKSLSCHLTLPWQIRPTSRHFIHVYSYVFRYGCILIRRKEIHGQDVWVGGSDGSEGTVLTGTLLCRVRHQP